MRRSLGRIPSVIGRPQYDATFAVATAPFSTSSSGSGGAGRGRGIASPFKFTVDEPSKSGAANPGATNAQPPPLQGRGRGRGQPLRSSPLLPSISSILIKDSGAPPLGRGSDKLPTESPQHVESGSPSSSIPKKRIMAADSEEVQSTPERTLPDQIQSILSGAGRGKPGTPPVLQPVKAKTENRHIRPQQQQQQQAKAPTTAPQEQLSREEKVLKAVEILSRGDEKRSPGRAEAGAASGRGMRGGMRGGMVRGRGRGRTSGRGRGFDRSEKPDAEEDDPFFGDPEDEQKVAEKLGPEVMSQLREGMEEMSSSVLPSVLDDAALEAYETNIAIECEPEWLMEEFGTNPDIDEKPPLSLRESLEKMKPFLMLSLGIESQQEWEEVMEETMKTAPIMKEIVDHFSGPDRITAKQQQEELERVAKTLPASAPSSVQRFTERALLTLQSNPGWKFSKKCHFMNKLVKEVAQQYK